MPDFDMPNSDNSFEARGGWLVKRIALDFNIQLFQAAGSVGNLGFESGGFKVLQEIGVSDFERGGYGWAQWTGPRRRAFETWCVNNKLKPSSDEANYGYLCVELKGAYHNTITLVSKTKDISEAVFSVGQTYERPGGTTPDFLPGFSGRLRFAQRALSGTETEPKQTVSSQKDDSEIRVLRLTSPMMKGEDVRNLQTRLIGILNLSGNVDGIFGKETEEMVKKFQRAQKIIDDGVFGPITKKLLDL